jgi:3-dehydroquinate dehydratase
MPIALHDAIKGAHVPVIELHISDVRARPSVTIPGSLPRRAR